MDGARQRLTSPALLTNAHWYAHGLERPDGLEGSRFYALLDLTAGAKKITFGETEKFN